jgi:hypothetical protein
MAAPVEPHSIACTASGTRSTEVPLPSRTAKAGKARAVMGSARFPPISADPAVAARSREPQAPIRKARNSSLISMVAGAVRSSPPTACR